MQKPKKRIRWCVLHDKDIHEGTALWLGIRKVLPSLDTCALQPYASESESVARRLSWRMDPIFRAEPRTEERDEPIIVSTRNVDVNIVIPWNEPPIATSPPSDISMASDDFRCLKASTVEKPICLKNML